MHRTLFKASLIGLSLTLLVGLFTLVLFPKKYDVLPFESRPGTQYWNLSTGSKIGYTKLASKTPAQRTPILYLHGGPGGMITDAVMEAVQPLTVLGYDIYLYDQVGSGHSARLPDITDYSVARHKQDLAEIVNELGVDEVILFGHSWGATLAMAFVADYPERVERLMLTGPGPILPINRQVVTTPAPDSLNLRKPFYSNQAANDKVDNLRHRWVKYGAYITEKKLATDKEMDDFFTYWNSELAKSTLYDTSLIGKSQGGGGYYSHIMTVKSFAEVPDQRARLAQLDIPILILRGQYDNQRWGYTQEYLDLFPNAELKIIERTGHSIHKEAPAEYRRLISDFLTSTEVR